MKLKNERTKKVVSHNVFEAKSLRERLFGLVGKDGKKSLLLHTRFGIHTFGMPRPIDVLVLDQQNRVIKLRSNLPPNRIFLWNPKYSTVIELPEGTIERTDVKLGDAVLTSK